MRKFTALGFAVCGTLLIVLLFIAGRMLYIKFYDRSYLDIAETPQTVLTLSDSSGNERTVDDPAQVADITALLESYTYVPYPRFFKPDEEKLTAVRLTVTFANGSSIAADADGHIFVDGTLRDVEGGRGQEFYHKLFLLFYPGAAAA